jgi:3-oxoacyl-[acyl-carrier-protein] synthase-3
MSTAARYIETGRYKKVLLIGADKMSSIIDYTDRTTCIIFGDGAGAVLFEPNTEGLGLQDEYLRSDGNGREFLKITAGGSLMPPTAETVQNKMHYVYQDGKSVFKFAVSNMAEVAALIMERNGLSHEDVDWLVPHQANKRIIDATANRMGLDSEKVMINIQKYGNTTSATLPLLLHDYESQLKKGDKLVFAAFGGGFTWGSIYLTWAYDSQ